jgi:protein-S-isoprenylcysteine O-methyltransferase Ste14
MFVVSLACGVWFFAVTLGQPAGGSPGFLAASVANTVLFSFFALHHSVMARPAAKRWIARHFPAVLERSLYVWTASILFLLLCLAWMPIPGDLWRLEGMWRWAARGVQAVAFVILVAGARAIDPLDLAGIRAVHGSAASRQDGARTGFSARGPYGVVRHPIYTGAIALLACMPDMTAGRFLFAALTTVYVVVAIPWEERTLVEQHGAAYREYQRLVRWRLVPGVF